MPTWAIALLLVAGVNAVVLGLAVLRYGRSRQVRLARAAARRAAGPGRVATVSRLRWTHQATARPERSRHRPGA